MPGRCAKVAGEMCKGCREDVIPWGNKVNFFSNQLKLSLVCKLEWSLTISRVAPLVEIFRLMEAGKVKTQE